jgi:hypothetical protein
MVSPTPAERGLELFLVHTPVDTRLDWLANQLLALAAEGIVLSFRVVPVSEGKWTFECSDSVHVVSSDDPGPLRVFRPLLARFAKMAVEENSAEFTPYGGKLHFDRPGLDGPTRLTVEFRNTTVAQTLALTVLGLESVGRQVCPANDR